MPGWQQPWGSCPHEAPRLFSGRLLAVSWQIQIFWLSPAPPGTHVRFLVRDGRIEIEPVPLDVSLERHGSTVVAVPREGRPVLTAAEVEETTTSLRSGASSASDRQAAG